MINGIEDGIVRVHIKPYAVTVNIQFYTILFIDDCFLFNPVFENSSCKKIVFVNQFKILVNHFKLIFPKFYNYNLNNYSCLQQNYLQNWIMNL